MGHTPLVFLKENSQVDLQEIWTYLYVRIERISNASVIHWQLFWQSCSYLLLMHVIHFHKLKIYCLYDKAWAFNVSFSIWFQKCERLICQLPLRAAHLNVHRVLYHTVLHFNIFASYSDLVARYGDVRCLYAFHWVTLFMKEAFWKQITGLITMIIAGRSWQAIDCYLDPIWYQEGQYYFFRSHISKEKWKMIMLLVGTNGLRSS